MVHKLAMLTVMLGSLPGGDASVGPPAEPAAPQWDAVQRTFLSRLARRTIQDFVTSDEVYEPSYVPSSLGDTEFEAVVRIRRDGYLLAEGAGGPAVVHRAVREASLAAAEQGASRRTVGSVPQSELLIEIEIVGPPKAIPAVDNWIAPRAVDDYIEPGVHGIIIQGPGISARVCPTEVFTSDMTVAQALKTLAQSALSDPSKLAKTKLHRFRTDHWYEARSGAEVVALHRGLTVVDPDVASARGLDAAIGRLAAYMAYRQKKNGLFAYQYEPASDRYTADDNIVRQAGAVAAMAAHAAWSGKSASTAAALMGINRLLEGLSDIPGVGGASFIATPDGENKLGVTALLTMAMADHPDAAGFETTRDRLVRGMLYLQRPSGMFITAFPPAPRLNAQDYFPGEALLAMAVHYRHRPSPDILEAFDRAMEFYRQYFQNRPSPAFVPWQVQAYALMARFTKRKDYEKYVFELTDWLAAHQLDATNCPWPELHGGIAAYQTGRAGVATASYLEGFADALALARDVNDEERTKRYEQVVRAAARFVVQLEVRPEEAYFVRSSRDAIGGVRTTPSLNFLRIDHVQHALVGLIKARKALYPDHD